MPCSRKDGQADPEEPYAGSGGFLYKAEGGPAGLCRGRDLFGYTGDRSGRRIDKEYFGAGADRIKNLCLKIMQIVG